MAVQTFLLAAASFRIAEAAAVHATTVTACPTSISQTAQFDGLPTGTVSASPFKGANWTGFSVTTGSYAGVKPHSGANVAMAGPFGAHLDNASDDITLTLRSLSFACVSFYPYNRYFPVACNLHVYTETSTNAIQIIEHGPYNFAPDYSQIHPPAQPVFYMQNITFDQSLYGSTIWFMLSDAPGTTQLVFDDIVTVQRNNC